MVVYAWEACGNGFLTSELDWEVNCEGILSTAVPEDVVEGYYILLARTLFSVLLLEEEITLATYS